MSDKKLGNTPAFPLKTEIYDGSVKNTTTYLGMSKRLYIATKAMQGILANTVVAKKMGEEKIPHPCQIESIAKASFKYADELLKQENE